MDSEKSSEEQDAGTIGRIFNIQYFCVHDGPGIRTTVFLKGCPLRCLWCHNPEGISKKKHLSFAAAKCINCGACVQVCPSVHQIVNGQHEINWEACTGKEACIGVCVTKALDIVGKDISVEQVMTDVMREKRYYDKSEGGVTISGGEPTQQPEFLLALLRMLRKEQVPTALETCGFCDYKVYERALPYVDLFLYDMKDTDPEQHKRLVGVENRIILENLRKLHAAGANILLRCPIVPGLNDRDDHFRHLAELSKELPNLRGVELLPYHKLGATKASRMGLEPQKEYEAPSKEVSEGWNQKLAEYGGNVYRP
jgi:pyruvate formate lyase activating enzyme